MQLIVTIEHRFFKTPGGDVWTESAFPYSFWTRYLMVFDSVRVIGRALNVDGPSERWIRADGPSVQFWDIPYYVGPFQYARSRRAITTAVQRGFQRGSAVILRAASQLGTCLVPVLAASHYPYGMEVVCDPYEVFAPGAMSGPLRAFFRWWFCKHLKAQCAEASGVAYVTQRTLQKRYPPRSYSLGISDVLLDAPPPAAATSYSSVALPSQAYSRCLSRPRTDRPAWKIVSVATMSQRYKGHDILLRAARICVDSGMPLRLVLVGDGCYRSEFERLAQSLGIMPLVTFLGALPTGSKILEVLDSADLFVHPSRADGLPRAVIEAMARGLPCIASNVGGIPELLGPDELVPPNSPTNLAAAISALLNNPSRMAALAEENWRKALDYRDEVLAARRKEFYEYIRLVTHKYAVDHP